jgi:hypothetical protein
LTLEIADHAAIEHARRIVESASIPAHVIRFTLLEPGHPERWLGDLWVYSTRDE